MYFPSQNNKLSNKLNLSTMHASSKIVHSMISKYFNIHTLVCYIICAFNRFKIHSRIHCSDTVKLLKITSKCKKGILKSAFIFIQFF